MRIFGERYRPDFLVKIITDKSSDICGDYYDYSFHVGKEVPCLYSNGTYYCKVYRKVGNGHYEYDLARYKENEIEIIKSYQWKR